jgi:PAS domain S-box-containing protein
LDSGNQEELNIEGNSEPHERTSGDARKRKGRGRGSKGRRDVVRASHEQALQDLLRGLNALAAGDFTVHLPPVDDPLVSEVFDVFNRLTRWPTHFARRLLRAAIDAVIVFDRNGRITAFNAAAEQMFRCTAREAMGAPLDRFFPDERTMLLELRVAASRAGERKRRKSLAGDHFTARRTTNETFPIEAAVSLYATGSENVLFIRDISDRVKSEHELREQSASLSRTMAELASLNEELRVRQMELDRAISARGRFYASMSHELRTPINAVLGYSNLLLDNIYGPLNEKQHEGISRTNKAARHLLELVNDLLDLSRIEAGKIDLGLQPVSVPGIIEDLLISVRPLADEHRSPLEIEPRSDHEPLVIVSDPRRVRQILLNLLSNAIKFGKGMPIRVAYGKAEGGVRIDVIDHGDGISPSDHERIFHEFVQLGKSQLTDGTGLGLPISRRLAELLEGSLTVESRPGAGSTFRLALPMEPRSNDSSHQAAVIQTLPESREGDSLRAPP